MPEGRMVRYVPADNAFMQEAEKVRNDHSTESKQPTGAVIVKNDIVVAFGANKSRVRRGSWAYDLHQKYCIRKLFRVPSGTKYWLCPGCASHRDHAEARAVRDAHKRGVDASGADLYLYGHWWCCTPCWDAMIAAGIRDVYLLEGSDKLFDHTHTDTVIGEQ